MVPSGPSIKINSVGQGWPNPTGVNWSTLGIVADGVTDNTAALNALPTGQTIIGDCPASAKTIRYNGQWIWQSNLTIYQRPECVLKCYFIDANLNNSCITQTDLTTPLTNIFYYGFNFQKPDLTYVNRMLFAWIDHFTIRNFRIDTYNQAFYIRGSDQEFGGCYASNPVTAVGADFIRHFGNVPLVPTTPGRPANVWIHNCYAVCGDACYQIGQPFQISNWGNTSTDGVIVENSYGLSTNSNTLLIGQPGVTDPGANNYYVRNVIARNLRGAGAASAVFLAQPVGNVQAFDNILLQNIVLDGSGNTSSPNGLFNLDSSASTSTITNVVIDSVTALNPFARSIVVSGAFNGITIKNSTLNASRSAGLGNLAIGQTVDNATIQNNSISTNGSPGIQIGQGSDPTASVTIAAITNNRVTNISNNQSGILLQAVTGAVVTGNVVQQTSGSTTAHGASLTVNGATAGANNSTVTGNDFSGISGSTQVVCAIGQGNTVNNNIGAASCAP